MRRSPLPAILLCPNTPAGGSRANHARLRSTPNHARLRAMPKETR